MIYSAQVFNQPIRNRLPVVEQAIIAVALMVFSGGPLNVILSGGFSQGNTQQAAETDYALTRYLVLIICAIVVGLLFSHWKKAIRQIPNGFVIWPIVGLAGLSFFWSAMPGVSFASAVRLFLTTLFGLYIATRYTLKQQLQLLGWTFALIVTLSLIYAVLLPKYGIMGGVHAGSWRGIYTHKNTLGRMMTLSSTVFTMLLLSDRKNRFFLSIFLGLSILLLLLAQSTGALVNLLVMLSGIVAAQVLRAQYQWAVVLISSLLLIAGSISAGVWFNFQTLVVDVLGKDPTLTGRTPLWMASIEMIKQRPWLGYGYEAFWKGLDGPSADIWRTLKWPVPDAHNGFVELTLHLGLVGLIIFLVGYVINFARSLYRVRVTQGIPSIWPLSYLTYVVTSNITEQSLLKPNTLFWVLYVATTITLYMPTSKES